MRGVASRELTAAELAELRRASALDLWSPFRSLDRRLAIVGREAINGSDAYTLAMQTPSGAERHYFDVGTGLLVRSVYLTPSLVGDIPDQVDYEDYRVIDGVRLPFRVRRSFVDPWVGWTRQFTDVQQNVALEASAFRPPAG
jgi:hypothetical protein